MLLWSTGKTGSLSQLRWRFSSAFKDSCVLKGDYIKGWLDVRFVARTGR